MEGMMMRNEMKKKMERTEEILDRDMKNLEMHVIWSTLPKGQWYNFKVSLQMTLDAYTDDGDAGGYFPVLNLTIDPRVLMNKYPSDLARWIRHDFHKKYSNEEWYADFGKTTW